MTFYIRRLFSGLIICVFGGFVFLSIGCSSYDQSASSVAQASEEPAQEPTVSPAERLRNQAPPVRTISFEKASELQSFFEERDLELRDLYADTYIIVERFPSDFHEIRRAQLKKKLFHRIMLPLVRLENERVFNLRSEIQKLKTKYEKETLEPAERSFLKQQIVEYDLADEASEAKITGESLAQLLPRVHVIPSSLVLAQAVNESGWGTSRFCRVANNIFGEWTYNKSKGIKPAGVDESVDYRVRKFPNLRASVKSYMNNLNSHHAYESFRALRDQQEDALNSLELVKGLEKYSQRREKYVESISNLIRYNDYQQYDRF